MKKYICDMCNEEIKQGHYCVDIYTEIGQYKATNGYDLCARCVDKVKKLLDGDADIFGSSVKGVLEDEQ